MRHYLILLIFVFSLSRVSYSQSNVSSLGFNYSALVRDTSGKVQPLKTVKLRFTLLLGQNGTTANSPWIETQSSSTDAYGFVNVTIGGGTKAGGTANTFGEVDFTLANYWLLIEVMNAFTGTYEPLAKQGLQAVPYAKVASALIGGQVIPAGTIIAFGGDKDHIPTGWLLCDGSELDNGNPIFNNLFNAIGYNWGTSNHANKFNLPETRGLFLRGTSGGSSNDPDAASRAFVNIGGNTGDNVGSRQEMLFQSHQHIAPTATDASPWGIGGDFGNLIWGVNNAFYHAGNTSPTGGSETRPKNVNVNYIIKL